ncbi:DUF5662 family protein [Devosia neptuniae]|uniref:DUF5662 family protein n=1 Tax=Devosia neptuniae TaxID=191302 RepID=A0ABY6CF59_9HYPH|nr:DUF5662 family protein [Devosia neptuniae]UXN70875.1 DUF5662 family protein [Devosia neptuniae]
MTKAQIVTHKHIARVRELLGGVAIEMIKRGDRHDASKFLPIEMEPLERMQAVIDAEGPAQFGTPEYKRRTGMLGEMIDHHRANNSHHPEHYPNGISGMDLFDVVEMFFDWKAASERGEDSCMRLGAACDKYGATGPLRDILYNTAARLGYIADEQVAA